MATVPKSRRETSVIAMIRASSSCNLGPYTIAMIITEALQEYRDILSIGFSSANFTIGLSSPDFQLAVLYSRIIEESDLILDILPWCPEYVSFDLPWIIQRKNRVTPPNQLGIYMNNLISEGKLSQQCIRQLIEKQFGIPHISENAQETNQIIIDGLTGMGKQSFMPDFSYLMILELKSFYRDKFTAFRKCAQSCEELCDCAYQLFTDIDPALKSIATDILSIGDSFNEEVQFLIANVAQDIHSEGLYIAEELLGIGSNIHPLYASMNSIIDLTRFKSNICKTLKHTIWLQNMDYISLSRTSKAKNLSLWRRSTDQNQLTNLRH
ncbi:hypothetical protein SORBI_3008G089600 [Sorghum bicolor]|uniref:Uncharacterized protein n=1 Tax=Sorghum bicolor TaxID=4558 RepID=A0A1Z5R6R0_SORBI|nr:hypothetical protein SORBI_3008G089600 [Sorghum bicolor]OQU79057.1 hypothetical protein SORBI_3008G089600 [Sorghum bicolor]